MTEKSRYVPLVLMLIVATVVFHWFGWKLTQPPETSLADPGVSYFKPPEIISRTFGEGVAAVFPALVLTLCTLLGIIANILFSYTERSIKKLTIRTFGPLLISPLILFGTYATAKDQPDALIACLMAFQNGFFWQAIFTALRPVPTIEERK
jgi:hypothetical protein